MRRIDSMFPSFSRVIVALAAISMLTHGNIATTRSPMSTNDSPNAPKRVIDWMTLVIIFIGIALAINALIAW